MMRQISFFRHLPPRLRPLVAVAIALMIVCWLFSFASSFFFASGGRPAGGCDFTMRYNEIRCVLDRIDPFAITRGDIAHPVYVRFNRWAPGRMNLTGYTPWAYVFLLPFALLPKALAAAVYTLLELGCVLFLFRFAYHQAKRTGLSEEGAVAVSASLCLLVYPITSAFGAGNFGIPFAATIAFMADCLDNGNEACAGLCWAFLMCKPQIGVLFAVPVLLHRKWNTLGVAAGVCLAATFAVAAWLGVSPVKLLLEVVRDGDVGTYATDLLPLALFRAIVPHVPKDVVLLLHAVIGFFLCLFCCWRVRNVRDWAVRLAPPAFFCTIWAYGWSHDKCVYALVVAVAMALCLQANTTRSHHLVPLALSILCGASILGALLPAGSVHPMFILATRRLFGWTPVPGNLRSVGIPEIFLCLCSAVKTFLAVVLFGFILPHFDHKENVRNHETHSI